MPISSKIHYFCAQKATNMEKWQHAELPFRGAIFDMDGTLVDNSEAHVRAFARFCDGYGIADWQEKLNDCFGMGGDDIMRRLLPEEVIRAKGLQALNDEKEAIYRALYAPEIEPLNGLRELLERLRTAGIRCAVGSSGCRQNVDFVLGACGIADYFEVLVSGDRVTHCKPDPEIYLTAAQELGLHPSECIVFEDAKAGFEAAKRAGAGRIVAVATTLTPEVIRAETPADLIFNDFSEIQTPQDLL